MEKENTVAGKNLKKALMLCFDFSTMNDRNSPQND